MKQYTEERLSPADLHLDLQNPRMPDDQFDGEDDALRYSARHGALQELVDSIGKSGWLDYEPLIVLRDTMEVVEGNRRLAALRLIADPDLARSLGIVVPSPLHEDASPEEIRVWIVEDRKAARDYIGFKHINGPFKWDSFAKAKYAAEWLQDDPNIDAVSQRLGDTHKTVERLVNGFTVLKQAEKIGFSRQDVPGKFSFSHLYTAITRPAFREFLGLPDSSGLMDQDPVPPEKTDNLHQLMVWLYGQGSVSPVIRSQNPDLKRLADVIQNRTAVGLLEETPNLDAAYGVVEDRPSRFATELLELNLTAQRVSSLIGNYNGDPELLHMAESILKTVRSIYQSMQSEAVDPITGESKK